MASRRASATLATMTALPGSIALVDVTSPPDWWRRPGLDAVDGRLVIAGRDAEALARTRGTPRFVYDLERIRENAHVVHAAARRAGLDHRLRFALKANREPEVLAALRGLGRQVSREAVGIDACSPGEVEHALANGWTAGRDLLYRHQLLGARPRRHPRRRRPPQPRCRQPGRAGRPAGAGHDHRPARQPDDRRRLQRRPGLRRSAPDQAGHHGRPAG